MHGNEGLIDIETINIKADIEDAKEETKISSIISSLYATNDPRTLMEIYSNILCDENVAHILNTISKEQCFSKHFPEFYVKNKYGENVINCMQNSSYHRYGVFKHILVTIEEVGKYNKTIGDSQRKILNWTMLLHDIGKPYVKVITDVNTESFADHDEMSVELAKGILDRFYFTEEEKHLILTLIKYHDKFLNEGEITYDNLKILAEELENKRELFYLLIEVKDADAAAKSIEVYNKYKLTKPKYLEFANTYFENMVVNSKTQSNIVMNSSDIHPLMTSYPVSMVPTPPPLGMSQTSNNNAMNMLSELAAQEYDSMSMSKKKHSNNEYVFDVVQDTAKIKNEKGKEKVC
jgi:hypothetical protein